MAVDLQLVFAGMVGMVGMASAIDSALLLNVIERRNRRVIPSPVVSLILGTWLFHVGEFANLLLVDAAASWAEGARSIAMSILASGLLLMPSALLHVVTRLWRSGFELQPPSRREHLLCYLPLLLWPVALWEITTNRGPFLARVASLSTIYGLLTCGVGLLASISFMAQKRRTHLPEIRRFMNGLAVLTILLSILAGYMAWKIEDFLLVSRSSMILLAVLAPVVPIIWFSYFVIRYRLLHLIFERTFLYGAALVAVLLLHQSFAREASDELHQRFKINFGVLEAVLAVILILMYRPLRRRVGEALRYLFTRDVNHFREQTREMAVAMWDHLDDSHSQLAEWFVRELRNRFELQRVALWLFDHDDTVLVRAGDASDAEELAIALHNKLPSHASLSPNDSGKDAAVDLLCELQGAFAVRIDHAGYSGLLVLGRRSRAREFGDEEKNAILLLAELFGATLHSHHIQQQRLDAERQAAQNEKLSTLGMLTSCLAHEIKNPLSSIKTIATLMVEQSTPSDPHADDIRLILSEVDRLSNTTSQFLKFARPAPTGKAYVAVQPVVDGAVAILSNLAQGKGVKLSTRFSPDLPAIPADENILREIVFNLLINSIEAAERGGTVCVDTSANHNSMKLIIRDDGPGIAPEIRSRLFSPFATSKVNGTGLGLYIVRRNVEHLSGRIACESELGKGTCFTVELPTAVNE